MDSIHLNGAEDVRSAASTMRAAADEMRRAASEIDSALNTHRNWMDDWLQRFTTALEPLMPKPVTCDKCKIHPPQDKHPCPYRVSMSGDTLTMCTCCDNCQESCAGEIP